MKYEEFADVVEEQIGRCKDVLIVKGREYATEDRLHNFKVAAELQGVSAQQALAGMFSKHVVSVFDLCRSDEEHDLEHWDEKITDSINYLILLRAVIQENEGDRSIPGVVTANEIREAHIERELASARPYMD